MTNLMQVIENAVVSMTSLEIVEFINSRRPEGSAELRHDNFMAKVPQVLGEIGALNFKGTYFDTQNKERPCYRFPKRESMLMAMSYDYAAQAAIYDRWQELETQVQVLLAERVEAQTLKIEELNRRRNKVMENFSNFAAENVQTWTRITAVKKQLKGMEKELKLFVEDQVSRLREISIALRVSGDAETADDLIALIKEMQRDAAKLKPQPNLELDLWMSNSEVLLNNYISEKLRAN